MGATSSFRKLRRSILGTFFNKTRSLKHLYNALGLVLCLCYEMERKCDFMRCRWAHMQRHTYTQNFGQGEKGYIYCLPHEKECAYLYPSKQSERHREWHGYMSWRGDCYQYKSYANVLQEYSEQIFSVSKGNEV